MSSLARRLSFSKEADEEDVAVELNRGTPASDPSPPTFSSSSDSLEHVALPLSSCPTRKVCLYSDRALVERHFEVPLKGKAKKEGDQAASNVLVVISDVPQACEDSSIRVSLLGGAATILEVAVENVQREVTKDSPLSLEDELGEKLALEEKKKAAKEKQQEVLKGLKERQERLEEERSRLISERVWFDGHAAQQVNPDSGVGLSPEEAEAFLAFMGETHARIDARMEELEELLAQIEAQRGQLVETRRVKSVYLLLEDPEGEGKGKGEGEGVLRCSLSYLMPHARWEAAYDIRVQSQDPSKVELTFHGIITNSSGEHWKEVDLSLSTAQPHISGSPPALATSFVSIRRPPPARGFAYGLKKSRARASSVSVSEEYEEAEEDSYNFRSNRRKEKSSDYTLQAEVKTGGSSSQFRIPRLATINSDSKPHKVTVVILELAGTASHTIIPKLSERAYLRCKATNTSRLPFLPGTASVFMDDTFVASSELKGAHPGEEISLYLGADPTVLVEFKESFFQSTKGLLTKHSSSRYLHEIKVKNTKGLPIVCDIFDQLPKSQEDKIKVTVLRPQVLERENPGPTGCTLVPANNSLRWNPTIAPGASLELVFEYEIDFPSTKLIDFVV